MGPARDSSSGPAGGEMRHEHADVRAVGASSASRFERDAGSVGETFRKHHAAADLRPERPFDLRVVDPAPGANTEPTPAMPTSRETGPYERGLAEAARLFASQGYAGTSMRQIADALGLTMGTLYHYFTSKEDILYQICRSTLSEGFDRLKRSIKSMPPTSTALDEIRDCLHTHVETITGSLDAQTTMLTELRSLSGDNRDEIAGLRRRYASLVESVIARGRAGGALRDDIPASVLTILFFNLTNWIIFWFRQDGRLSSDQLANAMSDVLVDGIRNRAALAEQPDDAEDVREGL